MRSTLRAAGVAALLAAAATPSFAASDPAASAARPSSAAPSDPATSAAASRSAAASDPASSGAAPSSGTSSAADAAGAYACWQAFASYGPTGRLGAYHRVARGTVELRADGAYRVRGERWFLPRGAGRAGRWSATGTRIRFIAGPYWAPGRGYRIVGDLHPDGIAMPHDLAEGTRYELVLRSRRGARPAADAPPRAEREDAFVSFWYCRAA